MATTPGGYWRPRDPNKPIAPPVAATPVDPNRALRPPAPPPAALGIPSAPTETPEQRAARTGVNVGGVGAVSGQVAPPAGSGTGTSAMAALGVGGVPAPGSTGAPGAPGAPPPGSLWAPAPTGGAAQPAAAPPPASGWRGRGFGAAEDTATVTSGLSSGDGTATRTGAITNGGAASTGTKPGNNPVGDLRLGGIGPKLSSVPILGDALGIFAPSQVDLSPGFAAQRAAYGISDDLDRERYDYRPGDAPSMNIDSDIRQRQLTSLDALTGAANGTVPSAAELQSRREAGRAVAATLGQARALGGRSAGGAARAGTMASADILARNNVEGAQLRATEQANARNALSAALGATRGQDTDISKANLGAQLDTNQLAEQHRMKLLEGRLSALGIGSQTIASILGAAKANADSENKNKGQIIGTVGAALGL